MATRPPDPRLHNAVKLIEEAERLIGSFWRDVPNGRTPRLAEAVSLLGRSKSKLLKEAAAVPSLADIPLAFASMADGFDYCREKNRPIRAQVGGETWHLFPSGRADKL